MHIVWMPEEALSVFPPSSILMCPCVFDHESPPWPTPFTGTSLAPRAGRKVEGDEFIVVANNPRR